MSQNISYKLKSSFTFPSVGFCLCSAMDTALALVTNDHIVKSNLILPSFYLFHCWFWWQPGLRLSILLFHWGSLRSARRCRSPRGSVLPTLLYVLPLIMISSSLGMDASIPDHSYFSSPALASSLSPRLTYPVAFLTALLRHLSDSQT